ncbi:MAG: DNA cytosine methyltransferase [Anaerolineae bacterium]
MNSIYTQLGQGAGNLSGDHMPIVLDLFCGAGGMSLGFQMAGYHIGLGVEKEELSHKTHCYNFGNRCHLGDIRDILDPWRFIQGHGLEWVDVIIGGPPCQGFSRVGRGKLRSLKNDPTYIHDPRNQYYKEFIRFIEALQPLYFVMENVPDMQYYADGDGLLLDKALHKLEELGYRVGWDVLQADHYGVPQTRKRLFIIGNRLGQKIQWPEKTHEGNPVTVWQAISDLPIVPHGHRQDEMSYEPRCELNEYQQLMHRGAGDGLYNHQTRWHNEQDLEAFAWLPEGGKYVELPDRLKRYRDDIFKDKYWKLYRDRPSWTIEAHIGKDTYRHIYPSRKGEPEPPRTISVREAARLQSFPDQFRFLGAFTRQFFQVGNAVPPLLAKAVAEAILPGLLTGMTGAVPAVVATPGRDGSRSGKGPVQAAGLTKTALDNG